MSARSEELYFYGIIEGALHSKGEDAYSVKVWHALRMLGKLLGAPSILPQDQVVSAEVGGAIERLKVAAESVMDSPDGSSSHRWLPWQVDLLREMKAKNEPVSAIATAVEKTPTQVNNKWFQLNQKQSAMPSEAA